MNPKVNFYFDKEQKWHAEIAQLRTIALECNLVEDLKWGCPCYTYASAAGKPGKNEVLIHTFKEYCAFLFFKGALLKDPPQILIQPTENVQASRQARFTNLEQILAQRDVLKSYIFEAVEVEEAGLKVELKKTAEYEVPEEFQQKLDRDTNLAKAFNALTPGRQRGYLFHFSQAKLSKTRAARVEKYLPKILEGKGLDDE